MFELGDNEFLEGKTALPNTVLSMHHLLYCRSDRGKNGRTDGQMSKYMCTCSRRSFLCNIYLLTKTASKSSLYKYSPKVTVL